MGADLLSQNVGGNYSTVRLYIKAVNGPGGNGDTRFLDWGEQVGSVDGVGGSARQHAGQPFLARGFGDGTQRWMDVWDVNIGHGADGTRGGVTIRMRLNYGGVRNEEFTATFNNFPRLSTVPGAPNIYSATDHTAVSFGINYTRGAANGAGIEQDHAQWSSTPDFSKVVWDDYGPGGYTNPRGHGNGPGPELASSTQYWVRVRSRNARGWSGWSNTGSGTTLPGAIAAPKWTQTTPDSARFSWTPPSGGAPILEYLLEVQTHTVALDGAQTVTGSTHRLTGTSFDMPGLLRQATYDARVRARNASGWTEFSPWTREFRPASAPGAPVIGTPEQVAPDSFKVTWTTPVDRGAPLVGYTLYLATDLFFTDVQTFDIGLKNEHTFTGLRKSTPYFVRVAARNAVTPPGYAYLDRSELRRIVLAVFLDGTDGWTTFGPGDLRRGSVYSLGENASIGLLRETYTVENIAPIAASTRGIQRTVTTVPGREYVFTAKATALADDPLARFYKLGVVGIGSAGLGEINDPVFVTALPEFRFTATATEHVLRIYMGAAVPAHAGVAWVEAVGFFGITLTEYRTDSPFRLTATVYESALSNHFNLACQSVGAAWWVDRFSVTRFREHAGADSVKATFTDSRAPGALEYTDLTMAYDSKNVVNLLDVTNYGVAVDGNEQNITSPHADEASVALYGARKGTLNTNLHVPQVVVNKFVNPTGFFGTDHWWVPTEEELYGGDDQFRYNVEAHPDQIEPQDSFLRFRPRIPISFMQVRPLSSSTVALAGKPWSERTHPVDAGTEYISAVEFRTNLTEVVVRMRLRWKGVPSADIDEDVIEQRLTINDGWVRLVTPPISAPAGAHSVYIEYEAFTGLLAMPLSAFVDIRRAQFYPGNVDIGYRDFFSPPEGESIRYTLYVGDTVRQDWTTYDARIDAVIEDHSVPFARISSIRWNAAEDPALAAKLDIQDRIKIIRNKVAITDYRIVGRRDDVQGNRWMVTFEVVPNDAA
jgi:hypothetical protein